MIALFQSSGSLYGALIGSVMAFNIADFLGIYFCKGHYFLDIPFYLYVMLSRIHSIGRRKELIVASIFYLVGALITSTGPNFAMMMIGRFIFGIGIGLVFILL